MAQKPEIRELFVRDGVPAGEGDTLR